MGLKVSELVVIINILFLLLAFSVYSFDKSFPTANLSTVWTNNNTNLTYKSYLNGSLLRIVILNISSNSSGLIPAIGCGFYGNITSNKFYFIVFAVGASNQSEKPKAIWVANRNNSVSNGATLELTSVGDLVLKDVDGSHVWSTNTSGHSVVGMRIDGIGNLIIHDARDKIIWQTFDHPTDTWVSGQRLKVGQRLVASVSKWNRSAGNLYSVLLNDSFNNFIEANPPQMYANYKYQGLLHYGKIETRDLNLVFLSDFGESGFAYITLGSDGHLRHYKFVDGVENKKEDILSNKLRDCAYPTVCGNYGICSDNKCSCPKGRNVNSSYFQPLDVANPSLGCNRTTQLSCTNMQHHTLLELENVTYLSFVPVTGMNIESCKQACLDNCSCKAAVFLYRDRSSGNCSLPNNIFSLKTNTGRENYRAITFLKVEVILLALSPTPNIPTKRSKNHLQRILVPTFSVLSLLVMFALGFVFSSFPKRNVGVSVKNGRTCREVDSIDQVSGNPKRFSYDELKSATGNFNNRLGGGGFGSVFEGCFQDGTRIAVKCLEHLGQGRKEFLAEVKTIGSIHHVNLVRLLGYCAEKFCNLLVYEYMCNSSLDKWIYHRKQDFSLDWSTRRNIILDIAKGLSYLHEDCQKKIVHLDIKPQNILLDGNFNAKLSDFGLARFIDQDQSQVLTAMRGTRGYLAPEWFLNKRISEKVDVYSFGIVVLEIMCGRKNLDYSQPEENECLLHQVKKKAEEGNLVDIVDKRSEDMLVHTKDVVKIIRIAIWCLQSDYSKRPSMSKVVKVLEGVMDMDNISDYSYLTLTPMELPREVNASESAALMESILSGPR